MIHRADGRSSARPVQKGQTLSEGDATTDFDDAVAGASDFVTALLVPATDGQRLAAPEGAASRRALAEVLVALADSRDRKAGDDEIVSDLDRAQRAGARAKAVRRAEAALPGPGDDDAGWLARAFQHARELALDRAVRALPAADAGARVAAPLVASGGIAALHAGVRLAALPDPVGAREIGTIRPARPEPAAEATPRQRALRRWAREALEELAVAGSLRRPRDADAWVSGSGFEARLGMGIDVLASLGRGRSDDERLDLARVVDDSLHEWSIPDPGRTFAAVFALGCVDGSNAAARLALHARSVEPRTAMAIEDAMALAASAHVDDVVLALASEDESPVLLARALRVARRRGRVPAFLAASLLEHPDPDVAVAAAQACIFVDPAIAREPLEAALAGPDIVAVEAALALAALRVPGPVWSPRLVALTSGPIASEASIRALRLRVLSARGDVAECMAICQSVPRLLSVDLLGWLGHAGAFDTLIAALGELGPVCEQAAWSLSRITGAGREGLSTIAVDDAGDPLPDPDDPARGDHDPHRRSPPFDPDYWRSPCAEARAIDAPRLRFGRPHAPLYVLDELADPRTLQGVRRVLLTEHLLLASGRGRASESRPLPLDLDDWVARQVHWLDLARTAVARDGGGALHASGAGAGTSAGTSAARP